MPSVLFVAECVFWFTFLPWFKVALLKYVSEKQWFQKVKAKKAGSMWALLAQSIPAHLVGSFEVLWGIYSGSNDWCVAGITTGFIYEVVDCFQIAMEAISGQLTIRQIALKSVHHIATLNLALVVIWHRGHWAVVCGISGTLSAPLLASITLWARSLDLSTPSGVRMAVWLRVANCATIFVTRLMLLTRATLRYSLSEQFGDIPLLSQYMWLLGSLLNVVFTVQFLRDNYSRLIAMCAKLDSPS